MSPCSSARKCRASPDDHPKGLRCAPFFESLKSFDIQISPSPNGAASQDANRDLETAIKLAISFADGGTVVNSCFLLGTFAGQSAFGPEPTKDVRHHQLGIQKN
jgi:hypothetical protein